MTPAASACSRVTVTADGGVSYRRREVRGNSAASAAAAPVASGRRAAAAYCHSSLKLSIRTTANPARVGTPMSLFVFVENTGLQSQRSVTLRVLVPQEMTPDASQIKPLGSSQVVGTEVRFDNVGELRPGETRAV